MRQRRVRAGSVIVWREALGFLRGRLRQVLVLAALLSVAAVGINVFPGTPHWQAGFLTGVLATFFVAGVVWLTWVPSGLAHRSMGSLAETWTDETLRKAPGVYAVIPSLKFAGRDVDHVAITRAGIIAVETKWRAMPPDEDSQHRAAQQAAAAGRTLRLSMRRAELPERLFQSAVVYWGPGLGDLPPRVIETALGRVTVMGGGQVSSWLSERRTGPVGADYAESLHQELHQVALERDRTTIKAGPLLRWLARIQ